MTKIEKIKIAVISNITLEPFFSIYLKEVFANRADNICIDSMPYDTYPNESDIISSADCVVVWLNIDSFYPNLITDIIGRSASIDSVIRDINERALKLNLFLKEVTSAQIIWIGAEDYCYSQYASVRGNTFVGEEIIDRINIEYNAMLHETFVCIDLKAIIAKIGIYSAFDNKSKYRWNTPYSRDLLSEVSKEIYKQHLIYSGVTKKCIVLDCDYVLWGGILSEDGIEGIHLSNSGLGKPYQDFQRFILSMYYYGAIIAICSKNDEADVLKVFREHDGMMLKEENISIFCVNWDNKSDNIKKIAHNLNISLDSIVFVDDSDFEVQSVRNMLPEVTAIKYDRNTIYEELSCFNLKQNMDIENVRQRTLTYRTNKMRELLKNEAVSFETYLESLDMHLDIHKTQPAELSRIAELTQRTNKCTNGKRYTVNQLDKMLCDGYELYSVFLSDKYSDLGLVGAIGIENGILDLFSLSCRALGRKVEDAMLEFVTKRNIRSMIFADTQKNDHLKNMLSDWMLIE